MARDRSRMRCQREVNILIVREDVIKELCRPQVMLVVRLAMISFPQLVLLRQSFLYPPRREVLVDVRPVTSSVASMFAENLSQELLDQRIKRRLSR